MITKVFCLEQDDKVKYFTVDVLKELDAEQTISKIEFDEKYEKFGELFLDDSEPKYEDDCE